jgi:protein tyrosine phosphatase (PTP) superfamily phosphohydrolase (DUF442 family)
VQREGLVAIWVGEKKRPAEKIEIPTSCKSGETWGTRKVTEDSDIPPCRTERDKGGATNSRTRRRKAGMDITWLTDRIAIGGGIWNAENMAAVAATGITHIIDMQIEFDDTPLAAGFEVEVFWNPTDDDFQPKPVTLFRRGVRFAREALDGGEAKLFIHCAAGVHRAPMMALALLGTMGWNMDDAMELIGRRRPTADFPDVYVTSVEKFLEEDVF